ncbi:MAG TPA: hypothetical protein VFO37_14970, partial [Chitinophagaceae bacterium]|nr:hypothetical protein [Chitinophagaceae bacterium]
MKKVFSFVFLFTMAIFSNVTVKSQTFKVGVFDVDIMVQAMPAYGIVDSLMQIFDRDSLGALQD